MWGTEKDFPSLGPDLGVQDQEKGWVVKWSSKNFGSEGGVSEFEEAFWQGVEDPANVRETDGAGLVGHTFVFFWWIGLVGGFSTGRWWW
jgi:hypothetical protein